MKYKIQWQDRWGNWQHYQTKTNEADAFRVMKQMVKQKGIRHRIVDENNSLIDLLNPEKHCQKLLLLVAIFELQHYFRLNNDNLSLFI